MSDAQTSDDTVVAEPTLDDVISEFNVEAPKETAKVEEFTPPQPQHIDPYDEASINQWAADTAKNQAALQSEFQRLKAEADATRAATEKAATDAKIKSAVDVIAKGIEGIDPLAAEFILDKAARENEKFAQLFHDQDKNPDMYKNALSAIIRENEGKFTRVDNQLAENHRAAQQSQQSNNTPATSEFNNALEERLANAANENERAMIWAQIKNGG